jgi:transcriptional repressor NrdR
VKCPLCNNNEDRVLESRSLAEGTTIRRRRECTACGFRFTSYERIEEKPLIVLKSSGRREPFNIEKLERGIQRALEKRSFSPTDVENIVNELESKALIMGKSDHEIKSKDLGDLVLKTLFELDHVAYVRFASVYRNFNNLDEFINEIKTLGKNNKK